MSVTWNPTWALGHIYLHKHTHQISLIHTVAVNSPCSLRLNVGVTANSTQWADDLKLRSTIENGSCTEIHPFAEVLRRLKMFSCHICKVADRDCETCKGAVTVGSVSRFRWCESISGWSDSRNLRPWTSWQASQGGWAWYRCKDIRNAMIMYHL